VYAKPVSKPPVTQGSPANWRRTVRAALLLSTLCLVLPYAVVTAAADARPKVGLVLSGGGIKGGAHLGVLRALEEYGVAVDYIAGTSIGAGVGGMYASGMRV